MDLDTHPNPQPDLHHRRVDVQSPHDLTYLQNNLAQSALQKLDLHFPRISKPATHISLGGGNGNGNKTQTQADTQNDNASQQPQNHVSNAGQEEDDDQDPMRRRVHDLVSEFLLTTWQSASHNISVNGIDATSLPVPHTATLTPAPSSNDTTINSSTASPSIPSQPTEIEGIHFNHAPFDASLQHKLASLHAELESLTAQVSKLRRTAPSQGAETTQTQLAAAMEADDEQYARETRELQPLQQQEQQEGEEMQGLEIEDVREGWNEDVREIYEGAVAELAGLAGAASSSSAVAAGQSQGGGRGGGPTLTETVGKAQRARKVAMEME